MKNILLISNNKKPIWTEDAKQDYKITVEKTAVDAFKSIFKNVPDVIVYNLTGSIFECYHFAKLMEYTENVQNIPLVLVSGKTIPAGLDFNASAEIAQDLEYDEIAGVLEGVIFNNELSKSEKTNITKMEMSEKEIKAKSDKILDNLLMNSSIVDEFKSLIDSMSFEDVLSENIFKIIRNYVSYDIAGFFFNNSDERKRNIFNLSVPNKNISLSATDEIRDKFFDEMEKYKRINEIQCNLINGDVNDESDVKFSSFKTYICVPYIMGTKLTGGFMLASTKPLDLYETMFLNIIVKELEVVYKLRYMFNEQANHALYDVMTGLFNKQEFDANLEQEFHRARRYIYNFTLAMLDIDYLSKINEQYGKEYGDYVIVELSNILKEVFRRTDLIYRYGGEEIIVLLPSTPITKSIVPIERLRSKIANHTFEKDGIKTNVTVSVGLCANYSRFTEPEQILESVGTALLRAKEKGRNSVDVFE